MTTFRTIVMSCDWPHCNARFDHGNLDLAPARKAAAAQGWRNIAGLVDLCGSADQAEEHDPERPRLRGHADAGHLPILTTAGKGHVKVSCSCTWVDPVPWAVMRVSAHWRWSRHLDVPRDGSSCPYCATGLKAQCPWHKADGAAPTAEAAS